MRVSRAFQKRSLMCFRNVIVIRSSFVMFEESEAVDRKLNDVAP